VATGSRPRSSRAPSAGRAPEFSAPAVQAAQSEPNLKLVDGPRFVDMLAAHGVLLQVGKFGELKRQK